MQVISRIRKHHNIEITIKDFFADPTISGVARLMASVGESTPFANLHDAAHLPPRPAPALGARERGHESVPRSVLGEGGDGRHLIDFGLFFFAGDEGAHPEDRYRMVMDAARLADESGLASIWVPERHFNKFGGLYPNPSVLGAAIAAVTKRIHVRGGSVVAPLHHPVRIAEEWSVVDNLSKGRIGIAFGSGFHPKDFLLAPGAFHGRKDRMFAAIESLRNLWRGGTYTGPSGLGEATAVELFPKPYSAELPIWLATTRDPATFAEAGKLGAGVLTALLRLTIPELKERIEIYRKALEEAGYDPGVGKVTVMLHTFLAPTLDEARSRVEAPLKAYLRSHMEHTRAVSVEKAGNEEDVELSQHEEEILLEHAFQRYFETSSLMGTEESCVRMVKRLEEIGVDEVGCLIDFGVDEKSVLRKI
jgi:natural product biosynthesis luciferase-like monooxygenase protein